MMVYTHIFLALGWQKEGNGLSLRFALQNESKTAEAGSNEECNVWYRVRGPPDIRDNTTLLSIIIVLQSFDLDVWDY